MKVVLAGTNGFIGGEVLTQCIEQNCITSIVVLSRRELPKIAARDDRIKVVLLHDFAAYSPSTVQELAGATVCIWTLGGSNSNPTPAGQCQEVEVEYALTTANALLCASNTNLHTGESIRFLFISGILSERDQKKSLWFLEEGRKARSTFLHHGLDLSHHIQGLAEIQLNSIAKEHEEFESVIIRAGKVLKKGSALPEPLVGLTRSAIRVDELAAAMVDIALRRKGSQLFGNSELRSMGKSVLKDRRI